MNISEQAELQTLLEGLPLPAEKQQLLDYALAQDAGWVQITALRDLREREYGTIDEVGEELVAVQPPYEPADAPPPREESGAPPGGDAYVLRPASS